MANLLQPSQLDIQKLIQSLNNGQFVAAEKHAQTLLKKFSHVFILHHVLALALDGQQKFSQSVISYENAIKLQPNTPDLYFNLGIALGHSNKLNEAIDAYQKALKLNPKFFEAYGNLGTIYQQQGQLEAAIKHYQQGLTINPQDARGHYNLGTAFRDQGLLTDAIASYQHAIKLFPNYTDAYNNLGETLRDHGNMQEAVKHYQMALSLNPNHPNANYNMGEFLYLAKKYDDAVEHFDRAQIDDWQARSMYSLYKAERFNVFKERLDLVTQQDPHNSPLISTLATHYAINFNQSNDYNFCKNALDYVYQNSIHALATPNSTLLKDLLHDIHHADIAERVQGMLHYGKQSAGNLFKRPESSFQQLAKLVLNEFRSYQSKFSSTDCGLISAFPNKLDFTSSWFVKMQKGGHLSPHIHEIGWISGAVYLAMPAKNGDEGAFEYGTHGDEYPISPSKSISDFPTATIMPNVGDIVLFPSSLFHRTIPFNSNEERICIAFDLKPNL